MGKKEKRTPAEQVRRLMRKGKVKKKCCRSTPLCGKCPVRALHKIKASGKKAG